MAPGAVAGAPYTVSRSANGTRGVFWDSVYWHDRALGESTWGSAFVATPALSARGVCCALNGLNAVNASGLVKFLQHRSRIWLYAPDGGRLRGFCACPLTSRPRHEDTGGMQPLSYDIGTALDGRQRPLTFVA